MPITNHKDPRDKFLARVSYTLKAVWIFFPGIIFLLLGLFLFLNLPQGQDIIYQSTDAKHSWLTGIYLVLAAIFWVFTTWYTARLLAYDKNDLHRKSPGILAQFPRILGFSIFLVLWLAVYLIDDINHDKKYIKWIAIAIDFFIYWWFNRSLEKSLLAGISQSRANRLIKLRIFVRVLLAIACIAIIIGWNYGWIRVLLYTLPVLQFGFLFLVIVRYPIYKALKEEKESTGKTSAESKTNSLWQRYLNWAFKTAFAGFDKGFEKSIFLVYHILAGAALFFYLLSINNLSFARELTSFPLVLLSFGILLGIINILSLVSSRSKININFLIIAGIVLMGFFFETHEVRKINLDNQDPKTYEHRKNFEQYLENWIEWHKDSLDKDTAAFPVFFTLADGGASRSGYWAASVLSRLHENTRYDSRSYRSYFMDHLFCMSGASGGSVGNASFLAAYAIQQKYPELKTDSLCKEFLGNDFLVYPLARILGPDLIKPLFGWLNTWGDRAYALEHGIEHPAQSNSLMGDWMRGSFSHLLPNSENKFPILSINTTRVNDGGPGIISTIHVDSSNQVDSSKRIFGARIDVISLIPEGKDIRLSTAMILGARFPYMSPGGKLGKSSYFVDGGYFDNSGAGVVHEMLLELNRLERKSTSPLLRKYLRRLHFYVIHLSNTPITDPEQGGEERIHPAINDLATPLLTLAGSFNSQTNINDARLTNYLQELNSERKSYIIFNLYKPGRIENISMNWVISNKARDTMDARLLNRESLDRLVDRMRSGQRKDLLKELIVDHNKAY